MSIKELQVGDKVLVWGKLSKLVTIEPDSITGEAFYYFRLCSGGGFFSQFTQEELEEAIEYGFITYESKPESQ